MGELAQTGSRLRSLARSVASKVAAVEAAPRPVVLVVDDDADVRDALATVLASKYRVRPCASGDQAVRIADSETEAVVLDIRMPHRDGFWTYQSLRAKLPLVPIIFYSAYQNEKDPFEVINDYKPFAYISKGSPLASLEAKVAEATQHFHEINRCRSVSQGLIVRLLSDVRVRLGCDQVVFVTRDQGVPRIQATVGAETPDFDRGAAEVRRSTSVASVHTPILFDGSTDVPCANLPETLPLTSGAWLNLPVKYQEVPLGAICARWSHPASLTGRSLRAAQGLAEEMALTANGSSLCIQTLREQLQQRTRSQEELRARLDALQARINPHFLYNSLNSILGLISEDSNKAESTVLALSEVFRHVLRKSQAEQIPLSQELEVVRAYLNIEKTRLGERLAVQVSADASALDSLIPPLVLLPLVENAVSHGVSDRPEGGLVAVGVWSVPGGVRLSVRDDGPGPGASTHRGTQTSSKDLRERLRLIYAGKARMSRRSHPDGGCEVTLFLPTGMGGCT